LYFIILSDVKIYPVNSFSLLTRQLLI